MGSIYLKELNSFFSSLIAYMVIGVFLILLGLILFVFPSTSILDYGIASLDPLFEMAPWVFMFLIPAITMRAIAEERKQRTLELLSTHPLTTADIVVGKFLASFTIAAIALVPTLVYYYTVYDLGSPAGNLDSGAIAGSYLGLLALAAIFSAIGIFASSLSQNQIVSFVLAAALCFVVYYGFEGLSQLPVFVGKSDNLIQQFGIESHYRSISRGLIVVPDVVYFICVTAWFILTAILLINVKRV